MAQHTAGTAQLWGNTAIQPQTVRQTAEWMVQQSDVQQGAICLMIVRYRPQYMPGITNALSRVSQTGRDAARRIRNNMAGRGNRCSVVITVGGTIIG